MVRYCYIVAEGPQDVEFLIRLLKPHGLKRVTQLDALDEFWKPLIPDKFPFKGDLMKRVPVPMFLQNSEVSVAVDSANGIKRLTETLEETLALITASQVFGLGVILDADDEETPPVRFQKLSAELAQTGLTLPPTPGVVTKGAPRCGIFIIPDNETSGTLEDILLDCAEVNYPDLLEKATNYIDNIDAAQLDKDDLRDFRKQAGKKKAVISSITSVLKPGKALQVSLQDNRWLDGAAMNLPQLQTLQRFLEEILGFV
ncbi:MAG: hypothetical protein Fur0025_19760 [Oscillatoriaceae cyanobacterium]